MDGQTEYTNRVDDWVLALTIRPIEWSLLLESLPSVYPETVWDSLRRLALSHQVQHSEQSRAMRVIKSRAQELWQHRRLPTPHLVDGCWWFADSAIAELSNLALDLSDVGDLVALLGAPTLFDSLREKGSDREIVLIDRQVGLRGDHPHQRIQADLVRSQPQLLRPASVIVVDPPWYQTEIRGFLTSARRNSRVGTKILLSMPPIGTRPGISAEWTELIQWCEGMGLRLLECRPLALKYISPPFEANALRAARVPVSPSDWRRGDLAVFECVREQINMGQPASIPDDPWHDVDIGRVRIKIKRPRCLEWASPIFEEIVRDDVLPSVSRRDARLGQVALWTSGNRVFGTKSPGVLRLIVEAIATGDCPTAALKNVMGPNLGAHETTETELTSERLRGIVEVEELELEKWSLNANLVELPS